MKKLAILFAALFCLLLSGCDSPGKTQHMILDIGASAKFTDAEIDAAVEKVKSRFFDFRGCDLLELSYDEAESDKQLESFEKITDKSQGLVFFSSFYVGPGGHDGSLTPDSTYDNWMWILVRVDKDSEWMIYDMGY